MKPLEPVLRCKGSRCNPSLLLRLAHNPGNLLLERVLVLTPVLLHTRAGRLTTKRTHTVSAVAVGDPALRAAQPTTARQHQQHKLLLVSGQSGRGRDWTAASMFAGDSSFGSASIEMTCATRQRKCNRQQEYNGESERRASLDKTGALVVVRRVDQRKGAQWCLQRRFKADIQRSPPMSQSSRR